MRIAINGFGRIGRNFIRAVFQDKQALQVIETVAINLGPMKPEAAQHLFTYDTFLGKYSGSVVLENTTLIIDGYAIKLITEMDPSACPWQQLKIDWVVESSGAFTDREGASKHITAGAHYVLISAPSVDADIMIIPGVNLEQFDLQKHIIVSLGSCTTNAIIPTLKVLIDKCGLEYGFMTTIHAYTNSQVLLDIEHKDLRRARAAAQNIIPTTTGAAQAIGQVIPQLKNKMACTAIRVPVAKVSLIDVSFVCNCPLAIESINQEFFKAAKGYMKGIIDISMEPLVSSDYMSNSYSVVIDGLSTQVVGNAGKVFGWYDNEWGYSERLKDFLISVR